MKKLDRLIIKAFIGPFVATFFITLLVLIMQFFWLYIDDFVGKGLDTAIILEFILYLSATLVPLALPLAILLSSLMTFGNLGESFELVAIKSSGISLLRFMRPLFFIALFLAGVAFVFSNHVIPVANLKQRTLLADIVYAKPAFDLKEGVFYDKINGFAIKIGKKEDNDSVIWNIIIYEQSNPLQDNFIIAHSGIMRVSENRRLLEFKLKDGWRYQERGNFYDNSNTEFIRIGFKEFKKQFDLSSLGLSNRTADSVNRNQEKMLSMRQLKRSIDSLTKRYTKTIHESRINLLKALRFPDYLDSALPSGVTSVKNYSFQNFDEFLPDSARSAVNENARNTARSVSIGMESLMTTMEFNEKSLTSYKIEWHRKIVLSVACILLFMIGAPLGAIIRRGGFGTPLIFAIVFFMVFYFSSTTGEKFAKHGKLTPFSGMWLATFILLPIGIFLTLKALQDSQLLTKEFYFRMAGNLRRFIRRQS